MKNIFCIPCIVFLFLQDGNWVDRSCEEKHGFICMKQSAMESTGDEVEVNIGCKVVSQAFFNNNRVPNPSTGCHPKFSLDTFLTVKP